MSPLRKIVLSLTVAGAVVVPGSMLHADLHMDEKGFVTLQLGEEKWEEYPSIPGIQRMTVYGDPSKPGLYLIRVRFSPGVMSMPHFHPEDRLVTVLKGGFMFLADLVRAMPRPVNLDFIVSSWSAPQMLFRHEGAVLALAQRVLEGQDLLNEARWPYGPLMVWAAAAWLKLLGPSLPAFRLYVLLLHVVGVGFGAMLLLRLSGGWLRVAALAAWCALFYPTPANAPPDLACSRLLLSLGVPLLAVRLAERPSRARLAAWGAGAGAAFLYSHDIAAAAVIGSAPLLAFALRARIRSWLEAASWAAAFWSGFHRFL